MKLTTRAGLIRMTVAVVLLTVVVWVGGCYSCRCAGTSAAKSMTPSIQPETLRAHVEALAAEERNVFHPAGLKRAERYIEEQWRRQGFEVRRQTYRVRDIECANLEVTIPGTTRSSEIVVVGAHYDSVIGSPGANDNATGVAAMLEISRQFKAADRTVRFVAFVNEEPPFFQTELMGSRVYARACRQRDDDIRAMLSLETLGYYSDKPGSQKFPSPLFALFYPRRGNFLAFVSDYRSRPLLRETVAAFRAHSDFPAECVAMFRAVAGIDWSDHGSFWREGYRAVMVTDTALFRYPHYHEAADTPDKIDYESLARVTAGLCGTVMALALLQ